MAELREMEDSLAQAKKSKWRTTGFVTNLRYARERFNYYTKVKAALVCEQGPQPKEAKVPKPLKEVKVALPESPRPTPTTCVCLNRTKMHHHLLFQGDTPLMS